MRLCKIIKDLKEGDLFSEILPIFTEAYGFSRQWCQGLTDSSENILPKTQIRQNRADNGRNNGKGISNQSYPELHGRIIVGTSLDMGITLITNDPAISESKFIKVIWQNEGQ